MPDIDDKDHVTRIIKKSELDEDGEITSASFELRKNRDESYLSVNHVEFFIDNGASNEIEALRSIREDLKPTYTLNNNHQLAILNVGKTVNHVKTMTDDIRVLDFCKKPSTKNNFSHAGIFKLKFDDIAVQELIAESVVKQHMVSDL